MYLAGDAEHNAGGPNHGEGVFFLGRFGTACDADCGFNVSLDLFDFLCFVNTFNSGGPGADCDADGAFTLFDFLCFVNAFNAGC